MMYGQCQSQLCLPLKKTPNEVIPTQKPLALLERIIKASCPEGGIVLDAYAGCATTCVAAQKLNRNWIGIDITYLAINVIKNRLLNEFYYDKNLTNNDGKIQQGCFHLWHSF